MGKKSEPWEIELYRAVDEVLFYIWDPIGVSRSPEARNEYHSYLPQVYALLTNSSTAGEISHYLGSVIQYMGLSQQNPKHDAEVAEVLLHWRDVIRKRYA